MRISYQFVNLDSSPALTEYAEKKFANLEKILTRFGGTDPELHIEFHRTTRHHHKGEVYRVSAKLTTSSGIFEAEDTGAEVREVLDSTRDKLRSEVERAKERSLEKNRK